MPASVPPSIPAGFEVEASPKAGPPSLPAGFEIETAPKPSVNVPNVNLRTLTLGPDGGEEPAKPSAIAEPPAAARVRLPLSKPPVPAELQPDAPAQTLGTIGMYGVPVAAPPDPQLDPGAVARGTVRNIGNLLEKTAPLVAANPEFGGRYGAPPPTSADVQQFGDATARTLVPLSEGAKRGSLAHGVLRGMESLISLNQLAMLAGITATGGVLGGIAAGLEGYPLVAVKSVNLGLSAYFASQAAEGMTENVRLAFDAYQKGDAGGVAENLGLGSVNALFTAFGAAHINHSMGDIAQTKVPRPPAAPDQAPAGDPIAPEPAATPAPAPETAAPAEGEVKANPAETTTIPPGFEVEPAPAAPTRVAPEAAAEPEKNSSPAPTGAVSSTAPAPDTPAPDVPAGFEVEPTPQSAPEPAAPEPAEVPAPVEEDAVIRPTVQAAIDEAAGQLRPHADGENEDLEHRKTQMGAALDLRRGATEGKLSAPEMAYWEEKIRPIIDDLMKRNAAKNRSKIITPETPASAMSVAEFKRHRPDQALQETYTNPLIGKPEEWTYDNLGELSTKELDAILTRHGLTGTGNKTQKGLRIIQNRDLQKQFEGKTPDEIALGYTGAEIEHVVRQLGASLYGNKKVRAQTILTTLAKRKLAGETALAEWNHDRAIAREKGAESPASPAVIDPELQPITGKAVENAGVSSPATPAIKPDIQQKLEPQPASVDPLSPPGPRWQGDRGAIPGEPAYELDGGKAALVERETPKGVTWEALTEDGESLGEFSFLDEAARAAEEHVDSKPESKPISTETLNYKNGHHAIELGLVEHSDRTWRSDTNYNLQGFAGGSGGGYKTHQTREDALTDAIGDISRRLQPIADGRGGSAATERHIAEAKRMLAWLDKQTPRAGATDAPNKHEVGPHGPIFREHSGDAVAAIARLQREQTGEVPGAWTHPELGPIDLIWGDARGGLAHIIAKHVEGRKDLTLSDLAAMIPEMRIDRRESSARTVRLVNDTHRAAIRLDYDGVSKRWLVSAFEKRLPNEGFPVVPESPLPQGDGHPPSDSPSTSSVAESDNLPQMPEKGEGTTAAPSNLPHPKMGALVTALESRLRRKVETKDTPTLVKLATEILGDKLSAGKYEVKDLYDAFETAVNRYIATEIGPRLMRGDAREAMAQLDALQLLLPTQTARTETQRKFQQFSTPPTLSYLAARAADIHAGDVVVEPSAGTGSLAAFAKAAGAEVETNELDPGRAAFLELQGYTPSSVNAERIHDHRPDLKPDLVLMNPPFSATAGRTSTNKNSVGYQHVLSALDTLPEGGRLVAILGRGASFDHVTAAPFWDAIKKRGATVRANIGLDGSNYAKYGTTFDNRLIIVDKAKVEGAPIGGDFKDLAEAFDALQPVINDRRTAPENAPAGGSGVALGSSDGGSGSSETPALRPGKGGNGSVRSGRGRSGKSPVHVEPSGPGGDVDPATKPQLDSGPVESVIPSPGRDAGADRTPERFQPLQLETGKADDEAVQRSGAYQSYRPTKLRTGVSHQKATGTGLVESAAMGAVEPPDIVYAPHLPESVIKSGHLTDAQLEAITYAGQAHSIVLQNGKRAGFMVGDGTGVGKGSEAAGIALDNWNQGRRKILWLSLKPGLIKQAQRDLDWVESPIKAKLLNDWDFADDINHEGVVFGTYSMLHRQSSDQAGRSRLDQIEKWNPDVILMDESHAAKNAVAGATDGDEDGGKQMRLKGTTSKAGEAVLDLDKRLPNARLTYFSATAFTDTKNLGYATRLGLWGPGTSFPEGFKDFLVNIDRGGMGAMELVAKEMKATGRYLARQISFDGVEYKEVTAALTQVQRGMYDAAVNAWQTIFKDIDKAIEALAGDDNTKSKGIQRMKAISQFWSTNQRFYRGLITAMKIPTVISEIEAALERDHSIFIDLVSTGEAEAQRQLVKAVEEDLSFDELDMSSKQMILNFLDRSFPTVLMEDYENEEGEKKTRVVVDAKGQPVHSQEALAMREKLKADLDKIQLPQAPMDQLIDYFGSDAIAEVSGRTSRIVQDPKTGRPVEIKRVKPKGATAKDVNDWERQQFQSGKKRIAIASGAGGTGFDFHSDKRNANQQRRTHIVLEPSWSADQQMQKFGRTHRTNQANAPEYILIASDLGGEKRFISAIASRIASLGALTRGERKAGGGAADMLARYNLEGKYGEAATQAFFKGLAGGKAVLQDDVTVNLPKPPVELGEKPMEVCRLLGVVKDGEHGPSVNVPVIKTFLNRVLNLPTDVQGAAFNYFMELFDTIIEKVKEAGEFDEGTIELKAQASRVVDRQVIRRAENGTATNHVTVEAEFPNEKNDWEMAQHHVAQGDQSDYNQRQFAGLYRNKRSGKLWMARKATKDITDQASGVVMPAMTLIGPSTGSRQTVAVSQLIDAKVFERVHPRDQRQEWEKSVAELPDIRKEDIHLITGSVLPVWRQLAASGDSYKMEVVSVPEGNGRSVTGIKIPADQIGALVSSMSGAGDNSPAMILNRLWRQGERIQLRNASLQAARVMGERAIVVQPGTAGGREILNKLAIQHVETASSIRYLIPYWDEPTPEQYEATLAKVTQVLEAFPLKMEDAAKPEGDNYAGIGLGAFVGPKLERLLSPDKAGEPARSFSFAGDFKSRVVRNLSQLEEASPEAHRAAVRAASSRAQASALMRAAMPEVMKALGGKLTREQFYATMIESRLLGTAQRWQDLADEADSIPKKDLVDWALSGPLQILDSMSEDGDLAQRAAALAANLEVLTPQQTGRNAIAKLRDLLVDTFEEASQSVHSMMPADEFTRLIQTPEFQSALAIYKRRIEPVLAESHQSNEGVFSTSLGPLRTYFPLVPITAEQDARVALGTRRPYKKPSNISNAFTTGLADDYSTDSDQLAERITNAFRVNDKAALLQTLEDQKILRPIPRGQSIETVHFGGREFRAKVVETSPARTILEDGRAIKVPASYAAIPEPFWHELKPILEPDAKLPPSLLKRIIHFVNEATLAGPAEAVIHSHNLLGTLIANTPFLGDELATKTIGNTPFTKTFTAIVKLATTDPMNEAAARDLQEMAKLGLLPERFGTSTYSAEYAAQTGAKLERPILAWGPLLYGPKGVDVRARLLMYRLSKTINPNASAIDTYKFVNQLGNYTEALQGHLERSLKRTGFSRFVTAGSTMLRNGLDAWLGMGSGSGPGGGAANRLAQMLSGGAIGLIAAWIIAYHAYTGKWPWEDKRAKLLKIPASDAARRSAIGKALWGKDTRKVGYINFGFFSPLVARGARGLGIDGGFNTARQGGNLAQIGEAVKRDVANSLIHPVAGPAGRAVMVGVTGKQPYLVDDQQGGSKLMTALPKKAPIGSEALTMLKQLNSFYGNIGAATGFGTTDDERGASAWDIALKSVIEMTGVISPASNPAATRKALASERRMHH